jgi:hypothetical protein
MWSPDWAALLETWILAGMNLDHLKKNVGYRVKLVPPAYHLDAAGEPLPLQDEDWIVMAVTNEYIEINTASGHFYRLGKDHVRSFATDPHRSTDGLNHAFLQLHVQLYVRGSDVTAVPNFQPGAAVAASGEPCPEGACNFRPRIGAGVSAPSADPRQSRGQLLCDR